MGHSQYLRRETLVNKDIFSKGKMHSLSIPYESMAALHYQTKRKATNPPTGGWETHRVPTQPIYIFLTLNGIR